MRSHKNIAWLLALGLAAVVALAGCGRSDSSGGGGDGGGKTASAPGITDTQVTVGATMPLSGPVGPNGQAAAGGVKAVFGAVNAQGGVKMADGKTRKLKFVYYDDGYDPAKAVQNFNKLVNQGIFSLLQSFGTAPNIAIMKPANAQGVPQVYVHAGDALFSDDPQANPWTIGWQPTYESEGRLYGEYLAAQGKPIKLAVLRQADTLGEVFLKGMKEGIQGSDVKIVGVQTYVPSDPSVDSQISKLKATGADALFMAVAVVPLMVSGIQHVQTLGWDPSIFLVSMSSSVNQVLQPGKLTGMKKLYTASFVKVPDNPKWSSDPDVKEYLSRMKQYAGDANPYISNAQWGYGAAETFVKALEQMKDVSRQGLMDAVRSMKTTVPMLLPGISYDGSQGPPINQLKLQHFEGGSWEPVDFAG